MVRLVGCACPAVLVAALVAQGVPAEPEAASGRGGRFVPMVEDFLASDQREVALRDRAAAALLADLERSLPWLGERVRALEVADSSPRAKGLRLLVADVVLGFVEQKRASGVVHRGQYSALSQLQPLAVPLLFAWLLETPDWFPDTRRVTLVPAIADLQPGPPDPALLLGITDLIESVDREPEDLRFALACLVWQWGRKGYVEERVEQLQLESAEGDPDLRVAALRRLADVWYRVAEYRRAASVHAAMAALADRSKVDLTPTDWYWGACYHALCGRVDAGLADLARCVDLLGSSDLDPSRRLPRALFETDPEIERLRADARFLPLLHKVFPPAKEPEAKDR